MAVLDLHTNHEHPRQSYPTLSVASNASELT